MTNNSVKTKCKQNNDKTKQQTQKITYDVGFVP